MSWHFWIIPLVIFWSFGFSRRWRHLPRRHRRDRLEADTPAKDPELITELEAQRNYTADLASRVAELENRLDFTERLLATRSASVEATSTTR